MKNFTILFILLTCFLKGQEMESGYFHTEDGSYTLMAQLNGDNLQITEPNRVTDYKRISDDTFSYYHPKFQQEYRLQILSKNKLRAYKPNSGTDTILVYGDSKAENDMVEKLVKKYTTLMEEDPDNLQAWSFCAAVAKNKSFMSGKDYENFASEAAKQLKLIIVDKSSSPCSDVISENIWKAAEN